MSYIIAMNAVDGQELDLSLLRAFRALLEERHVTRAAQRLGMTQSATSHALSRLRRRFDDPLFVRGPRGVVPTPRAEALGPEVTAILARLEKLGAPPGPLDPSKLTRRFVIGGADFAEMIFLPQLVTSLRKNAPSVDLVFRPIGAMLEEELARNQLDLAVGVFPKAEPRLVRKKLFEERFVCMLRKRHPALSNFTVHSWAEMMHVLVSPRGEGGGVVDEALAKRKLRRRIMVRTATFLTAPLLVEASDCVTTLPRRIAETMAKGREVVLIPPPMPVNGFTVSMVFHERSRSDPEHAWLRDQISAIARTL